MLLYILQASLGRKAAPSSVRPARISRATVVVKAEEKAVAKVRYMSIISKMHERTVVFAQHMMPVWVCACPLA